MTTTMEFLGLYSYEIEQAYEMAENICETFGVKDEFDDLSDDDFKDELKVVFDWNEPTNSIILAIFLMAERTIHEKDPNANIAWYINGYDTSIYTE